MSNSLYVISNELKELMDQCFDNDGEIDNDLEQKLKAIESELTQKTDNIVAWIDSKQSLVNLIKEKRKSLTEYLEKTEASIERFNVYVESALLRMDKKSIEGELCKISMPKKQLVVQIDNEEMLDFDYLVVPTIPKPTPNKIKIKEALKKGLQVDGASLVESKNVSIKYGWK